MAPSSPGYYSRLFVTPKVTGDLRPVIDLSRLNRSVLVSHFHMETAQSVLQSLLPGDWMVSLDLQDAYLQVPVHPSSQHYLRFCVGIPSCRFGLSASAFRLLRRCSRTTWLLSLPSCIITGSGSYGIWTTGSSWDPCFER